MSDEIREIKFENVGGKKQHKVTLIGRGERDVKMAEEFDKAPSSEPELIYAEKRLNCYYSQAEKYLNDKGYANTHDNNWRCVEGEIIRCDHHWEPLWTAIQDRDQGRQTGEYLAALIISKYALFQKAKYDYSRHDTTTAVGVMLDTAVEIMELFSQWEKLEYIQAPYSAGKKCIDAAPEGTKENTNLKKKRYELICKLADKIRDKAKIAMGDGALVEQIQKQFAQLLKEEPSKSQDLFIKDMPSNRTIRRALGLEKNQK